MTVIALGWRRQRGNGHCNPGGDGALCAFIRRLCTAKRPATTRFAIWDLVSARGDKHSTARITSSERMGANCVILSLAELPRKQLNNHSLTTFD